MAQSTHPYADYYEETWLVDNPGADATSLHFARLELEAEIDQLILSDAHGVEIQRLSGIYPEGLWSDPVPGDMVQLQLVTDGSENHWGFAVDAVKAIPYQTIGYSSHPYSNDSDGTWFINNLDPNANGTRLFFSRIDVEENVDWLIIMSMDETPYEWITGHYPDGYWTRGVPGNGIIVKLVSDRSVNNWGFNVAAMESAQPENALPKPQITNALAESTHPHPKKGVFEWTLSNLDPNAANTKIHIDELCFGDYRNELVLYDGAGNEIQRINDVTFGDDPCFSDYWSDDIPGRLVKITFIADSIYSVSYGFRVDRIANGNPNPPLAESLHPFPVEGVFEWTIVNPNANAAYSKVHFSRLETCCRDSVVLYDLYDNPIQRIKGSYQDIWSDAIPGRIVKVKLHAERGDASSGWGLKADKIGP